MEEDLLRIDDIPEIDVSASSEINEKFTAYLSEGSENEKRRDPFYCKELGFAMERLREGYNLSHLWDVIPAAGSAVIN